MTALGVDSHPSPHRGRVPRWRLWLGLFGAPLCWSVQTLVDYAFVAHGCFPGASPRAEPLLGVRALSVGVDLAALAAALACTLVALASWRATHGEKEGTPHHLLDNAEGRSRFMAASGFVLGLIFLVAIVVASMPVLFFSTPCR